MVERERGFTEPATQSPWTMAPAKPVDDAQHEEAVLALSRAFEHVLKPWFDGEARLLYRSVRDLVHLPSHPFAAINETLFITNPFAIALPNAGPRTDNHIPSKS